MAFNWGLAGLLGLGGAYAKKKLDEPIDNSFGQRSNLTGTQKKFIRPVQKELRHLNPQGFDVLRQLLGYEPEGLEEMQEPILEQWETRVVPNILERFSNSRNSGALNRALAQGARGVQGDLASLRANLQQQALGVRQNALGQLLNYNTFAANPGYQQNYMQQGSPNWVQQLAPSAGQAAARYFLGG